MGSATHLVFHLHPIAIAVLSAWVYRRVLGEPPCRTHAIAFVIGLAAILGAGPGALPIVAPADPPAIAAAIQLIGLGAAGWIVRRRPRLAAAAAGPR